MSGLNQYYAETIAYRVIDALNNQKNWYFRQLKGCLANCGECIPTKILRKGNTRRYFYVPEAFQDIITEAELKELAAYCDEDRKGEAIHLLRQVIVHGKTGKLSDAQVAVIREIHRQVLAGAPGECGSVDSEADQCVGGAREADLSGHSHGFAVV